MLFKRRFKDKYAGSSTERICCPNSVRLVFLLMPCNCHFQDTRQIHNYATSVLCHSFVAAFPSPKTLVMHKTFVLVIHVIQSMSPIASNPVAKAKRIESVTTGRRRNGASIPRRRRLCRVSPPLPLPPLPSPNRLPRKFKNKKATRKRSRCRSKDCWTFTTGTRVAKCCCK